MVFIEFRSLLEGFFMIGVLSDAHGNIVAFRSAINQLRSLGANKFYFLGDAIGYIPSLEVVDELMNMRFEVKCILGNHELMLLTQATNPIRESIYKHQAISSQLTFKHKAFLETWPTHLRESIAGLDILFVHGSPNDFSNEYVYPDTDLSQFSVSEKFVFMGHSHYPFIRNCNGTTFVNVGSCGLPRDDGRYGSCAILDPTTKQVVIYRYSLGNPMGAIPEIILKQIHPSVLQLFERRAENVTGYILTNIETKL